MGLTQWHANLIKNMFPHFNVNFSNYGIHEIELQTKVKNLFVYSSFPNRGLVVLLRMWGEILKLLPDATLNVYCNLEQEWVNNVAPETMNEIKQTINQPGITNHGWVSKLVLSQAWAIAEYWLYPCTFEETFCLTALEAAISKTCVITNGLAALSETARYGLTVPGDPYNPDWQKRCLHLLTTIENVKQFSIERNYKWAKKCTWKSQTDQLIKKLI
jgi:glycosyltransferase involved in cell wall biosynthesis